MAGPIFTQRGIILDPHADGAANDLRHWCVERRCRGLRLNLVADPGHASWILGERQARLLETVVELAIDRNAGDIFGFGHT